jgi:hypothetical protein
MSDAPDIGTVGTAGEATACHHWLCPGDRFLILPGGRTLCVLCGLSWVTSASERRELLRRPAPSGAA